jgi:predicted dehydrogenase
MLRAEQPNIVAICSPPHTHAPLTIQALQSGAHVVCEKPLVLSLVELDAIEAAERETGRTCTGIFQWRYGTGAHLVKRLIDSGEAGKPLLALCNTLWYRGTDYYAKAPWRGHWDKAGGGVAMAMGIHAMDMTLWLMGEWTEVSATTSSLDRDVEVDTVALAHVRFATGALGSFVNSSVSSWQESFVRLDLRGLTVTLRHLYEYSRNDWTFLRRPDDPWGEIEDSFIKAWGKNEIDQPGSIASQWWHNLRDLSAGRETLTNTHAVRPTYEFIASLYKSAATGQPVRRGEIVPSDPYYTAMNVAQTA